MVGLTDLLSEPVRDQKDLAHLPVADQTVPPIQHTDQTVPPIQHTDQTVLPQQCTVPIDENPFTLTNAQVDEVLRGLEETFTDAEVEELLRGLGETSANDESNGVLSGHYVDNEMNDVLDMCVEDYIV